MINGLSRVLSAAIILTACVVCSAAAKSGDLNGDYIVNWTDIGVLADQWLIGGSADLNGSGKVDGSDFAMLSYNWLGQDYNSNLVGWWKFDESTGTKAQDWSGMGNNGTLFDNGTVGVSWAPASGVIGGAVSFDGDGPPDNLTNPSPRVEIPTAGMNASFGTIAGWVRFSSPLPINSGNRSSVQYIFGHSSSANEISIKNGGAGGTTILNVKLGSTSVNTGFDLGLAAWRHVTLVWNSGSYNVYVDGTSKSSGSYTGLASLAAKAQIGNKSSTFNQSFHGLIDDFRIYTAALTTEDISNLFGRAVFPRPVNGTKKVDVGTMLRWAAGDHSVSHNIYFGTVNPPPYAGNVTVEIFNPGVLGYGKIYYWRIDEVQSGSAVLAGELWSFSTTFLPGQAGSPVPADSAAAVSVVKDLSWTAGIDAESHDVYFGTSNPPPFRGNQTQTSFDTGIMAYNTGYYWHIDERNIAGAIPGALWSFTTGGPMPPSAAFTASVTAGLTPLIVNFADQSTGDCMDYFWSFGDGMTSSQQNPSHTYTSAGSYTVSLAVTGPNGSDTMTKADYIFVLADGTPRLSQYTQGIVLTNRDNPELFMMYRFYEWNIFDAFIPATPEHKIAGLDDGRVWQFDRMDSHAVTESADVTLDVQATADGADLTLTVTNLTSYDWQEAASITPCYTPKGEQSCQAFSDGLYDRGYFYGPGGLELQADAGRPRVMHFNQDLIPALQLISPDLNFSFSIDWPTSTRNAAAGLMIRVSDPEIIPGWVSGVAWERYLGCQGYNPKNCMHLSVQVGPLAQGQTRVLHGKLYFFEGTKEDCLAKFREDFGY